MLLLAVLLHQGPWVVSSLKASSDSALNFLVLGDWGGQAKYPYTTPAERELAKVMGQKASEIGSQFTLALGDNFYSNGVGDVKDKRFNQTFEVSAEWHRMQCIYS